MAKASIKTETVEKVVEQIVKEDITTYNLMLNYRELDLVVTVLQEASFSAQENKKVLKAVKEAAESIYYKA